jgi:hypothetical protein
MEQPTREHPGSCHCGAVRFTARLDATSGMRCNCTICTKLAGIIAIAKPDAVELTAGERELSAYEWGSKTAKRFFCKRCGISVFSRGHLRELGGDYVAVNLNVLDDVDPGDIKVAYWDGRHDNWQAGPRARPWPIEA